MKRLDEPGLALTKGTETMKQHELATTREHEIWNAANNHVIDLETEIVRLREHSKKMNNQACIKIGELKTENGELKQEITRLMKWYTNS